MIVKNEAHVIVQGLESVLPFIDYWVICDTGSTDNTREVIKTFFEEKGVPGELFNHEWIDFGTNRSLALYEAQKSDSDYILMFDADDTLCGQLPLDTIKQNPEVEGWIVPIRGQGLSYNRMCLVKSTEHLKWGYNGVLHEYMYCKTKENVSMMHLVGDNRSGAESDFYITCGHTGSRSNDPKKYEKDVLTFLKAIEDTKDLLVRYTFYTAQSYRDAGLPDKAVEFYKERVKLGGWREEVYYSLFRIAEIEQTECAYLEAHTHSPHRAEPLHALARMFRLKGEYKKAYEYASSAKRIPKPEHALFVSDSVYDWEIDDEMAVSAYWLGNKKECTILSEQLLLRCPSGYQRDRIRKNAVFSFINDERFSFTEHWFIHTVDEWIKFILPILSNSNVLEIGSFEGMSAAWMCEHGAKHITCIDPFTGSDEHDIKQKENLYERFHKNVVVNFPDKITVLKQKSNDALGFEFKSFQIIYIDGDHHAKAVYQDAVLSWSLLEKDGIMIFDDYLWAPEGTNESDRPKAGIDAFLERTPNCEILHHGYQVMIKKRE